MRYKNFLRGLLDTITSRKRVAKLAPVVAPAPVHVVIDMEELANQLLSGRGEASGVARAAHLLKCYEEASPDEKLAFLSALATNFGPDPDQVQFAIAALQNGATADDLAAVLSAMEPRRQELIRRLNLAPGGTEALVEMRADVLSFLRRHPELKPLNNDFIHLLSSWFNRGFLVLKRIDWGTPAHILEKIIRYEAVHAIQSWDDLRGRTDPKDRRCFGFFHPALSEEPLIFVEVALTGDVPEQIGPLIALNRAPIDPRQATTAVFYSISSCQKGLTGISFGNFLIKQVVEELKEEFPNISTFVTLSPVPGFASWLASAACEGPLTKAGVNAGQLRKYLQRPEWHLETSHRHARQLLQGAAAVYFLDAKSSDGRPLDPVARFHLGNGARLDRVNLLADLSPNGLRQAHGLMVNYRYVLDEIEDNHEAYANKGAVIASEAVHALLSGVRAETKYLTFSAG